MGSSQPGCDLPAGLTGGHAAADLFAFGHAERPLRLVLGMVLYAAGLQHNARTDGPRLPSWRAISRSD
jgi:hypothetical protein